MPSIQVLIQQLRGLEGLFFDDSVEAGGGINNFGKHASVILERFLVAVHKKQVISYN